MIVPDGIEVYLKPTGDGSDNLRFPEFGIPAEQAHDDHYKKCFVPFSDTPFQIVMKFANNFNLFTGADVHIGIGVPDSNDRRPLSTIRNYWTLERAYVPGQICKYSTFTEVHKTSFQMDKRYKDMPGIADAMAHWPPPENGPYENSVAAGTITVIVQRGTANRPARLGQKESGAEDRERRCDIPCVPRSFKALRSRNGHKYRFEFMPRSQNCLIATENEQLMKAGQLTLNESPTFTEHRYRMIDDKEFIPARDRARAIRHSINNRDRMGLSRRSRVASKRAAPLTCDCPKESHRKEKLSGDKSLGKKTNDLSLQKEFLKPSQTTNINATGLTLGEADNMNQTPGVEPAPEVKSAEETIARTCSQCKNLKKPPRGKKIAWRKRIGRWMYVHEDAPEEEDQEAIGEAPSQTVKSTVIAQDRDNEEDLIKPAILTGSSNVNMESASAAANTQPNEPLASDHKSTTASTTEDQSLTSIDRMQIAPATNLTAIPTPSSSQPSTDIPADDVRTASAPTASSAATHVDVDLTVNDDDSDEVMVVKSEAVDRKDSQGFVEEDDSMEDLKYELREIEREKRKLELEAKEESIKRKIAKREAVKGRKIKEEIKIED